MKPISFHEDVLPLKDKFFRLALRITLNREEAEDIVQETLIKVWNNRQSWRDIDSIESYAMTICRNLSLDWIRKNGRQQTEEQVSLDMNHPDATPNPYEQAQQHDRMQLVRSIINSLPELQRSCLQLRDIEGMNYKEIAKVLGVSDSQVKISIYRARQTVKEKLQTIEQYGL